MLLLGELATPKYKELGCSLMLEFEEKTANIVKEKARRKIDIDILEQKLNYCSNMFL